MKSAWHNRGVLDTAVSRLERIIRESCVSEAVSSEVPIAKNLRNAFQTWSAGLEKYCGTNP